MCIRYIVSFVFIIVFWLVWIFMGNCLFRY